MFGNKKNVLRSVFGSGCGYGCGKTKLPDVIQPQPIHSRFPPLNSQESNSTSSASNEDSTSAAFSLNANTSQHCSDPELDPASTEVEVTLRLGSSSSSAIGGSIAVVKESDDPFRDFRDSMLRMILEKGIYSRERLEDLLRCFLELNSACYHGEIIRAFSEIWHIIDSNRCQRTNHPGIASLGSSLR